MSRDTTNPFRATPILLALSLLMASCAHPPEIGSVQRKDLFSIGYGVTESQIDLSAQGRNGIDLTMSEGIFHMLDGSSRKIMRLSSYGDLLALLYDPTISPLPNIVKPLSSPDMGGSAIGGQAVAGRYSIPVAFTQPREIAVGPDQTIYVADRVSQDESRIYDAKLAAFCDRVIRRFGAAGQEKVYIGQEGPGGSPFPAIISMKVLIDDTLGAVAVTESAFLVYHFGKEGNLLSSLRIGRDALPLPPELSEAGGGNPTGPAVEGTRQSFRIHANMDGMVLASGGETFRIMLKLDYYREYFDSTSLAVSRNEYAGSWIFAMDGRTGHIENSLSLATGNQETPAPELIGQNSGLYYLLYKASDKDDASWMIQLMDDAGKVHNRALIEMPEGVREMMTIRVSEEGQVYALLKMDEKVQVSLWDFK